jgi:hypothetical protein
MHEEERQAKLEIQAFRFEAEEEISQIKQDLETQASIVKGQAQIEAAKVLK